MKKEVVTVVQHHGDPVQDDIKNAGNSDALMQKRNTAMNQDAWALDGQPNKLPDYQHGDPLDYQQKKGK